MNWDPKEIQFEQVLLTAQAGRVRSVERELKQIFDSDLQHEQTEEVYEALAYGHLAAFDAPEFLQSLHYWLEWSPDAIPPRLMRAEFFTRIQKLTAAGDEYKALLKLHPDCLEARIGLGENLLALNLADDAAQHLRICYHRKPSDRIALLLAKALVQIDSAQEAQTLLLKYKDTPNVPVRVKILEELGRWHSDRDESEIALGYLQESVRLAPESTSAWHSLSVVYSMLGKSKEAANAQEVSHQTQQRCQRLFNAVTELSAKPESIELRMEAATVLFEQGMDKDAVAWLRTILALDLHHKEANRRLAKYYHDSGQRELELEHLKLGGLASSEQD
ncbi:MAG: tetratricopeptide repeat protein [Planctomycetaceae bacterium]